MTKMIDVDAKMLNDVLDALEEQTAEIKMLRPLSRGERLKKAEASLKPKTRGGKLIEAEREVEASEPRDSRAIYSDMRPAKRHEPAKSPDPAAVLARAVRAKRDAARR